MRSRLFECFLLLFILIIYPSLIFSQGERMRDFGIKVGILKTGKLNSITDVKGVKVGHFTLFEGNEIRTGVTAILPHDRNIFQNKVPAAIYIGNGFGKLMGFTQVEELGNIETPIILTNTLSVPIAAEALIDYTLKQQGNESVQSVNSVVGETNDGWLNDIQGRYIKKEHVLKAIENASIDKVEEGCIGAGTGTVCFGFKGGIGTSSRKIPEKLGGYTIGALVQTNFGGVLQIDGVPVGVELGKYVYKDILNESDGSCMIVIATDAPITSRNLKRLAGRALFGIAKTGGIESNGSGDYAIAFSTSELVRVPHTSESKLLKNEELRNEEMSQLFLAVIEATEEAILNSLFKAKTTTGKDGHIIIALPINEVIKTFKKYNRLP